MADASADEVLELIDKAARADASRQIDHLNDTIDAADRIVAQQVAIAAASVERLGEVSGPDPTGGLP